MFAQFPDAKTVQINLKDSESKTAVFMSGVEMLVSAQSNRWSPASILEAKKAEILAAKVRIELQELNV